MARDYTKPVTTTSVDANMLFRSLWVRSVLLVAMIGFGWLIGRSVYHDVRDEIAVGLT